MSLSHLRVGRVHIAEDLRAGGFADCWLRPMSICVRCFSPWLRSKMRSGTFTLSANASASRWVIVGRVVWCTSR